MRVSRKFGWRRPIDFGDVRRLMNGGERRNFRQSRDEMCRQLRIRDLANHYQQPDTMANDGSEFVRLIADSCIVGDGDPTVFAYGFQPIFVGTVGRKVIGVALYS